MARWRGFLQGKLGPGKLVVPVEDTIEWATWYENAKEERIVGSTHVGPLHVSTVFLGIDHGWGDKPRWFETMIFGDRDVMWRLGRHKRLFRTTLDYQRRYETWKEAEIGHKESCAWAQEYLDQLNEALGSPLVSAKPPGGPGSGEGA